MAFVNDYVIMDIFNAIDNHTGKMLIPQRIYCAASFKGGNPDYGQAQQRVINTDKISYLYKIPDPRMDWPHVDATYGAHENADEMGYIVKGEYDISYPDGTVDHLVPGMFYHISKGQSFRFVGADDETDNTYCVFFSRKIGDVVNSPVEDGKGTHSTKVVADIAAKAFADGVEVKVLAEADNMVVCDVVLKAGKQYPEFGYCCVNAPMITVILSGEGYGVYPDKEYALAWDTATYHNPGQPFKYINTGKEDLHMLVAFGAASAEKIKAEVKQISDMV